jgi:hypothetical protein
VSPLLVYLDTANFAVYAGARNRHRSQFRTQWRRAKATLALSFIHIIEIRQHADDAERRARYEALRDFLPIRTTMNLARSNDAIIDVQEREILAVAARRGLTLDPEAAADCGGAEDMINPFPFTISEIRDVDGLRDAEVPWFEAGVKDLRGAIEMGNLALVRDKGSAPEDQTLEDLVDRPMTPQEAAQMRIDAANRFGPLVGPGASASGNVGAALVKGHMQWIDRAEVVGPRRATIEKIGLPIDEKAMRRPIRELMFDADFAKRVRETLDRYCSKTDPAIRAQIGSTIALNDCPGRWLWHAVENQTRRAEHAPKPANYWDLGHAMYMPYVDRFFTDRRIETYIKQALRASDRPGGLTNGSVRRNADSLRDIADRIS